jgi:hypothetical protein
MTIRHLAYQFDPDTLKREMATFFRQSLLERNKALQKILASDTAKQILEALRVDGEVTDQNLATPYGAFLASLSCFKILPGLSAKEITPLLDWLHFHKTGPSRAVPNPARGKEFDGTIFIDLPKPHIAPGTNIPEQAGILLPKDILALQKFFAKSPPLSPPTLDATFAMLNNISSAKNALLLIIDQ